MSLFVAGVFADDAQREWFVDAWADTGKKLDMGKSCVRFKNLDDVALEVLGSAVARVTPEDLIAAYESVPRRR